jgi:hypothetical protein
MFAALGSLVLSKFASQGGGGGGGIPDPFGSNTTDFGDVNATFGDFNIKSNLNDKQTDIQTAVGAGVVAIVLIILFKMFK